MQNNSDQILKFIRLFKKQGEKFFKLSKKKDNTNAEDLHNLRVASRRFSEYLNVLEKYHPLNEITKIQKAVKKTLKYTTEQRDLDVFLIFLQQKLAEIPNPQMRESILYLFYKSKKTQNKISKHNKKKLNTIELPKFYKNFNSLIKNYLVINLDEKNKKQDIEYYLNQLLKNYAHKILVFKDKSLRERNLISLHYQRISLKKYRYTLEIKKNLLNRKEIKKDRLIKNMQDILGNIHDRDIFKLLLKNECHKLENITYNENLLKGMQLFLSEVAEERRKLFKKYIFKVMKENILEKIVSIT